MASSAQNPFAATAAPPPTPSFQPISDPSSASTTPEFLSHLLRRLPPSLSLPSRRSSPLSSSTTAAAVTPPTVSLSDLSSSLLSAATQHGFFHLLHHPIPSHLPLSAESAAFSLFSLPHTQKQLLFPTNWPLGHDMDDDDDVTESFCLDTSSSSFSTESTNEFDLECLREFSGEMEKLGWKVLEELASAVGFDNPTRKELCSLLWISDGANKPDRVYPYAVGLHYQIRCREWSLLSDSGRVNVSGLAESVFVTLGDIAQVWSNGKLKKVRGRPFPIEENPKSHCITMSLLITLPVESTVAPLVRGLIVADDNGEDGVTDNKGGKQMFHSFSFEDYAWRVYHQHLLLKDPLISYRMIS